MTEQKVVFYTSALPLSSGLKKSPISSFECLAGSITYKDKGKGVALLYSIPSHFYSTDSGNMDSVR